MTNYIKKINDNKIDNLIIEIFKQSKSITTTIIRLKSEFNVIISRAEVTRIIKEANLKIKRMSYSEKKKD